MKIAVMAITKGGKALARQLAAALPQATLLAPEPGIKKVLIQNWADYDAFICIMAAGIAVRAIAPLLVDKKSDPCVLVLDEKGNHVISLLSGHLGGGNALARQVAELTRGEAVITTASDTLGLTPLDIWAKEQGLATTRTAMTKASSILVNQGVLKVYSEVEVSSLPPGLAQAASLAQADICISPRLLDHPLLFHPRNLVVGIGCNRGTPLAEFQAALKELLTADGWAAAAICNLASIDKKNDEVGLLALAEAGKWPIVFFSKDEINQVAGIKVSAAAMRAVGAIGVAEPCALLSAQTDRLLIRKRKWQHVTMAMAQAPFMLSAPGQAQ